MRDSVRPCLVCQVRMITYLCNELCLLELAIDYCDIALFVKLSTPQSRLVRRFEYSAG